jgi:hypothetical protein
MNLPGLRRFALLVLFVMSCPLHAEIDIIFQDGFEILPGFEVQAPNIIVAPGEEATYCYYFQAPTASTLGVKRWSSTMSPGMTHLIVVATYDNNWNPVERQPPGTLTQSPCGLTSGGGLNAWVYAAHTATGELVLPSNDGSSAPLATELLANQPAVLQMHVINQTTQPLTTSAMVKAVGHATGVAYTKTATYLTINTSFAIPPGAVGYETTKTCAAPAGAKFWWLSTRTHKFATQAKVINSGSDVVVSTDWEHPSIATFTAPGFLTFPGGLTYQCTYNNPLGFTIQPGDSEVTNEACMGIGYFFPATRPMLCVNNLGPL